jgi:Fe-S cluster assembly protein SufD
VARRATDHVGRASTRHQHEEERAIVTTTEPGFTEEALSSLGGPRWLTERRRRAYDAALALPVPTTGDEDWRYSRIDELRVDRFPPQLLNTGARGGTEDVEPAPLLQEVELPARLRAVLDGVGARSGLAMCVDGVVRVLEAGPAGAEATPGFARVAAAGEIAELDHLASALADRYVGLATAFVLDGVVLRVPRRHRSELPFVVVHLMTATSAARSVFPRTLVVLDDGAEVNLVEIYVSDDEPRLVVPIVELMVGDGAQLGYTALQLLGRSSWQLGLQSSELGRDARLTSFTVALGGDYARHRSESVLVGSGGSSQLLATFFGDGTQVQDFRTLQEHQGPRTTSDLVFKGAVGGASSSVYSGMIRMRHGARGANAFQTNRNLVLSDSAHADSVPNLDIEENDVRCSHASAVGPIDAEQRFYLQSRGIPPHAAERLILLGFFEDLLARLPVTALRSYCAGEIAARLDPSMAGLGRRGPRPNPAGERA